MPPEYSLHLFSYQMNLKIASLDEFQLKQGVLHNSNVCCASL